MHQPPTWGSISPTSKPCARDRWVLSAVAWEATWSDQLPSSHDTTTHCPIEPESHHAPSSIDYNHARGYKPQSADREPVPWTPSWCWRPTWHLHALKRATVTQRATNSLDSWHHVFNGIVSSWCTQLLTFAWVWKGKSWKWPFVN